MYGKKRQARPAGTGQQSQAARAESRAVEASNKLLHVIWMRTELPAERSEDPGPV